MRTQMAQEGKALPDGSFPISNVEDLKNAISAYGRASDKEAAKKHIMKQAKALGQEKLIPANWVTGGAKVVEALGGADVYHLNEGHALPAFYYLRDQGVMKEHFVFTTHTPEKAGNEEHDARHLNRCGFFGRTLSEEELRKEMVNDGMINYTVSALRLAKKSNAVSKLHAVVSNDMWKGFEGISEIIPITNAQNQLFWQIDLRKN